MCDRALGEPRLGGRLAVYLEIAYWKDGGGYSVDRAFVLFLVALARHVDELVLVGRVREGRSVYAIPEGVAVHALADYPSLKHVSRVLAVAPRVVRALDGAVAGADHVLAIGPHPMSIPTVLLARRRKTPVALMVRQDFPTYIRHRLPNRRWLPAVGFAHLLEWTFRRLARRIPTVVVGSDLARRYRRSPRLLNLTVSLVPAEAVGSHRARDLASGTVELLHVGRLDPEKAPQLLIEALTELTETHGRSRFRLTIVGTGELEPALRAAAAPLGDAVVFAGYVAHGAELFRLYRKSDIIVHTALTEGVPQVLIEAQSVGIPIVATDVGGVRKAVADGAAAELVPPGDGSALARGIAAVVDDPTRRGERVRAGFAAVEGLTIERQVGALAAFLAASS